MSDEEQVTRRMALEDAIAAYVRPEMHLHFPSTPSRSNISIVEVARQFAGKDPRFVVSMSGFHSVAHLLPKLGLGRQYVACFFGDNFPISRPNALYQQLYADDPTQLQIWSLLTYVEALRAGAMGHSYAITHSLTGSHMARDLERGGHFKESTGPDGEPMSFVRAMQPDLVFVHALLGDELGNVVVSKPHCEGFWSTISARHGVIVTVEKMVSPYVTTQFRDAMPIPKHQVVAVCEAPKGCHPQPMWAEPRFGVQGYADDLDHYGLWREMTQDQTLFDCFDEAALGEEPATVGYPRFVEWAAKNEVGKRSVRSVQTDENKDRRGTEYVKSGEIMMVLAARAIVERVQSKGYRLVIAGLGKGFYAARLAKLWLDDLGIDIEVIVETGMVGIECGEDGHDYLLSYENMERAARISDAEDALGALTCGTNQCLGVLGAAQVDAQGNINSTVLPSGKFLVGSGGANDIASSAAEVIVLSRCQPSRLVEEVTYVTSPGQNVGRVVTELGDFARTDQGAFVLDNIYPAHGGKPVREALKVIRERCGWAFEYGPKPRYCTPISTYEMRGVHTIDPGGDTWTRER